MPHPVHRLSARSCVLTGPWGVGRVRGSDVLAVRVAVKAGANLVSPRPLFIFFFLLFILLRLDVCLGCASLKRQDNF